MSEIDIYYVAAKLQELLGGIPKSLESPYGLYAEMAHHMAYACDYKEDVMLNVLPEYGIAEEVRRAMVHDELNRERIGKATDKLIEARALAEADSLIKTEISKESVVYDANQQPLPPLPRVLEILTSHVPENFRSAMIISALPLLGTVGTGIRFYYRDGFEHSLSFITCLMSPSSTGKSFVFRKPAELLLKPISEEDATERAKDQIYKEKLRAQRNSKEQPQNPHASPRIISATGLSRGRLLELMSNAHERHLISMVEEIDGVTNNGKRGAWSSMSDILRNAFDNAETSQDFGSMDAFSGRVRVFYNLLVAGTPRACYRFFNDVEGGLVQRVAFVRLPDTYFQSLPCYKPYTQSEEDEVIRIVRWLNEQSGFIKCPSVDAAISAWDESKRQQAISTGSIAIDTLRRRSAVIGFRAGYLASLLNGTAVRVNAEEKGTVLDENAADFAQWVAEYVFCTQMALFGKAIEQVNRGVENAMYGMVRVPSILNQLPSSFTREELKALRDKNGLAGRVSSIIYQWKKRNLIKEEDGKYKKTL